MVFVRTLPSMESFFLESAQMADCSQNGAELCFTSDAVIYMVEAYLRQLEAVDQEVAELDVKIKKGVLPSCPEFSEGSRLCSVPRFGL